MKDEFVMVPRGLAETFDRSNSPPPAWAIEKLRGILDAPAEQHQGEPVAWRYRHSKPGMSWFFTEKTGADGCLIDGFDYEVQPLYTHADPGQVEKLRAELDRFKHLYDLELRRAQEAEGELISYAGQLAERDTLLREVLEAFKLEADGSCINPGRDFIRPWAAKLAALSSSAEPSAPVEPLYPKCTVLKDVNVSYSNSTAPVEADEISDKQRLDSIEKFGFSLSATKFVGGFCGPRGREWLVFKYGCGFEVEGETLREALDKARAALERKSWRTQLKPVKSSAGTMRAIR